MANVTLGEPRFIKPEVKKMESKDFDITFELDKSEETVVPFGIKDFKNNIENPFFSFKYTLSKSKIDSLEFLIMDEDDKVIYQMTHLKGIVVEASKKQAILFEAKKPTEGPLISKTWDFEKIFSQYTLSDIADYTDVGEYYIHWDGFDDNEIYDSTRFNGKDLKAKITATKGAKMKSITIDFSTNYSEVQWTDVRINKKTKRIDVTLRVNLTDGGTKGLSSWNNIKNDPPYTRYQSYDWDKIPASDIKPSQPIKKTRSRSFLDLEKLAIEGLNYHWGRNKNHLIAKNITVNNESYELYMNVLNAEENSIGKMELVYNTNGNWMRSGNPGSIKDPLTAAGNVISRQAIAYNVGYIYYLDWYELYKSKKWRYRLEADEDIDFKFTSAHEIGHEILKKYGGTFYSYGHKGTVNSVFQYQYDDAPKYPINSEIDIMPYYPKSPRIPMYKNYAASEKDTLGLIWLTKIEIK